MVSFDSSGCDLLSAREREKEGSTIVPRRTDLAEETGPNQAV